MYLRKYKSDLYRIVKSVREDGKVKTRIVRYVGHLTPLEFNRLKLLLKDSKEDEIDHLLKSFRNPDFKTLEMPTKANSAKVRVKLKKVRENVYKKKIDEEWLRKAYLEDEMPVGAIAGLLGVSKDRVREHLEEMGYNVEMRLKIARMRGTNNHFEFGWHIIDGQKIKDPCEFKIIKDMIEWRKQGISFEKIAKKLTDMGIKGRLGVSKWDRGAVRRMINRNKK